jgi:hypothetical protein
VFGDGKGDSIDHRIEGDRMDPTTFTTSDGVRLAYAVDDFTDPWSDAPTVVLLHGQPHNITNAVPERCALELRRFLVG